MTRPAHPVTVELVLLRLHPSSPSRIGYRLLRHALAEAEVPDLVARQCAGAHVQALHSTSWRWDEELGVVLTYAALPDPCPAHEVTSLVAPSVVCSGDPLRPTPDQLHEHHVAAHAVRHLAYLADRDPGIARAAHSPACRPLWRALAEAAAGMPTAPHAQAHAEAETGRALATGAAPSGRRPPARQR